MDERARCLLLDFIREKLDGKLDNIRTFDTKTLRGDDKFGCPGRYFDCDDTEIMRAIYVVLWEDDLPFLNIDNFGYRRQYRGDTVNTFHTMFGREIEGQPGFFAGLEKYHPSDELREKVRNFSKLCSNIGNYVVLPNYFARKTSLNCYRGTNSWHDFFDRFLIELHKILIGADDQDETLQELVKVNDFCFRNFRGEERFSKFVTSLFLEDYCNGNGIPQNNFSMNYHWKNEEALEQYFHDAELYLEKSEKIICNRAGKMIELLKSKICGGK